MYEISLQLGSFDAAKVSLASKVRILTSLLETLILTDTIFLEAYPDTADIYSAACVNSGESVSYRMRKCLHYQFESSGLDQWWDIPVILSNGWGDCEDLASWRIAELRRQGVPARPYILMGQTSEHILFHIQVWTPKGVEDPSVLLGMPPPGPDMIPVSP